MSASDHGRADSGGRRDFLRKAGALPAALMAGGCAAEAEDVAPKKTAMPQIRIGPHSISRLICGSNPFNGGSHLSVFVNRQMRSHYTPEKTLETLRRCREVGINCWQGGVGGAQLYKRLVDEGGKMHYIAIAHHGEVTDRLFKEGKIDQIHDYLKRVRDAGMTVGVSTHMPDVVDTVESKGWDVDYYMTCVYERHRSAEELEKLLGQAPIPVGEVYLPLDPPRMFKAIRQTRRPCLAFKILAAGRLSERRQWVEQAFRETFESIKPDDAVIVGIYDRYSDQPGENAALVRRFGAGSRSR